MTDPRPTSQLTNAVPSAWFPVSTTWRHVEPGDVVVGPDGRLWSITPETALHRKGMIVAHAVHAAELFCAEVDPDDVVQVLVSRPDVGTESAPQPAVQADEDARTRLDDPDALVATADGKPGCPVQDWLDGVYRTRCSFGRDECWKHGKFEVRAALDAGQTPKPRKP